MKETRERLSKEITSRIRQLYYCGLTAPAISDLMGINPETVARFIQRARTSGKIVKRPRTMVSRWTAQELVDTLKELSERELSGKPIGDYPELMQYIQPYIDRIIAREGADAVYRACERAGVAIVVNPKERAVLATDEYKRTEAYIHNCQATGRIDDPQQFANALGTMIRILSPYRDMTVYRDLLVQFGHFMQQHHQHQRDRGHHSTSNESKKNEPTGDAAL